jgi:hypothetical protein
MLVTVEFADAGVKTGTHRVFVIGRCSDMAAPSDIGMRLIVAAGVSNNPSDYHSLLPMVEQAQRIPD